MLEIILLGGIITLITVLVYGLVALLVAVITVGKNRKEKLNLIQWVDWEEPQVKETRNEQIRRMIAAKNKEIWPNLVQQGPTNEKMKSLLSKGL